ncbi:3D domain-containing protein [Galbibacter sp.]|uniref:3D domain-containing protein n=1 Tax=Galbibacter sp. TaxID=2918471 RepID=UPI003A9272C7
MKFVLVSLCAIFCCYYSYAQQDVDPDDYVWVEKKVKASAYNSTKAQTMGNPSIGAWGDILVPGMKAIAISRDLIKLGIGRNTPFKIEGYPGYYLVKDKMNARYKNKIDLYMGKNIQKAREFGVRHLKVQYGIKKK